LKQQAMNAATPFDMTVWQFRIEQVEALLSWLDDYEGTISTGGEK
jgi:hypothetical protein